MTPCGFPDCTAAEVVLMIVRALVINLGPQRREIGSVTAMAYI